MVFELTGGLSIAPQVTAAPPLSPALDWAHEPTVFKPPARRELDIIAARPLFSPSRTRFVAAQVEEGLPQAAAPLPSLELIGVLLTDTQRTALIRPLDGGDAAWVRENAEVAGWRIERIERSRVHLRAGERLEVVELRDDTAVPADARPKRRKVREEERRQARSVNAERASKSDEAETGAQADESD